MPEQTFIRPVPGIIEALSKAAVKAGDLSIGNRSVVLEVMYLGLKVGVSYYHGKVYKYSHVIGWLELSETSNPYELISIIIDRCVNSVNLDREKDNATSK